MVYQALLFLFFSYAMLSGMEVNHEELLRSSLSDYYKNFTYGYPDFFSLDNLSPLATPNIVKRHKKERRYTKRPKIVDENQTFESQLTQLKDQKYTPGSTDCKSIVLSLIPRESDLPVEKIIKMEASHQDLEEYMELNVSEIKTLMRSNPKKYKPAGSITDEHCNTVLHLAADRGKARQIYFFQNTFPYLKNSKNNNGQRPLELYLAYLKRKLTSGEIVTNRIADDIHTLLKLMPPQKTLDDV